MRLSWLDGPAAADGGYSVWVIDRRDPRSTGWSAAAAPVPADLQEFAAYADAANRLARRAFARLLVARACGMHPGAVRFGRAAAGRPLLLHPAGRHLALAGRGDLLLVGLGPAPFGADVELVTTEPPPWALLSPAERAGLGALPPVEAAATWARWWAAKEAHAKRLGCPRQVAPEAVAVDGHQARGPGAACSTLHFQAGPDWIACAALPPSQGR